MIKDEIISKKEQRETIISSVQTYKQHSSYYQNKEFGNKIICTFSSSNEPLNDYLYNNFIDRRRNESDVFRRLKALVLFESMKKMKVN